MSFSNDLTFSHLAFEDVMDCLQDVHFAVVLSILHKWKTADYLCQIEEHLIDMQKKKIGSIIDTERTICRARLVQLDSLYESATSVDAESDLRMMTHGIQLEHQLLERKAKTQGINGYRDNELMWVNDNANHADNTHNYPPIVRSLATWDDENRKVDKAYEIIDAFIVEMFKTPDENVAETSTEGSPINDFKQNEIHIHVPTSTKIDKVIVNNSEMPPEGKNVAFVSSIEMPKGFAMSNENRHLDLSDKFFNSISCAVQDIEVHTN